VLVLKRAFTVALAVYCVFLVGATIAYADDPDSVDSGDLQGSDVQIDEDLSEDLAEDGSSDDSAVSDDIVSLDEVGSEVTSVLSEESGSSNNSDLVLVSLDDDMDDFDSAAVGLWDKPFSDYSISESYLFLIFFLCLMLLSVSLLHAAL
jgi:hypothetical protein